MVSKLESHLATADGAEGSIGHVAEATDGGTERNQPQPIFDCNKKSSNESGVSRATVRKM